MLENLFEAVAAIDSDRRIHYANRRFRKLADLPESLASGVSEGGASLDAHALLEIPETSWDILRGSPTQAAAAPQVHSVPFSFRKGSKGFAQIIFDRLPVEAGGAKGRALFLLVLRDMTFEIETKSQLNENEKVIARLKRSHSEAQFLWLLFTEMLMYIEPEAVLEIVMKKLRAELGFADACFLHVPDEKGGQPEPVLQDHRVGSRIRQVAELLHPELKKRQGRADVFSFDHETFGTFWVTSFRPKLERPFFLLARSEVSAEDANRKPLLEPLAAQITSWLDTRGVYLSSITDSLTGLFNRRHFDSRFSVECLLAREKQTILSLVLVDVDHFKQINDSFGHQVGDSVLTVLGKVVKSALRSTDFTARVGGEEFAALLLDTSPQDALIAAEKIRKRIAETPIPLPGFNQSIHITVSCGIAGSTGKLDTHELIYRAADEALYRAKAQGRDCSVLSDSNG